MKQNPPEMAVEGGLISKINLQLNCFCWKEERFMNFPVYVNFVIITF